MLKKPFSAPMLTEYGRFEEIVLGEGNPICGSHENPPGNPEDANLVCLGGDKAKPAQFCDAWAPCGSS